MSEIFRIYVKDIGAIMTHQELRGMWEAACIEAGGKPEPGGVTVHRVPGRSGRVVVAGRAERTGSASTAFPKCHECGSDVYVHQKTATWGCKDTECAATGVISDGTAFPSG